MSIGEGVDYVIKQAASFSGTEVVTSNVDKMTKAIDRLSALRLDISKEVKPVKEFAHSLHKSITSRESELVKRLTDCETPLKNARGAYVTARTRANASVQNCLIYLNTATAECNEGLKTVITNDNSGGGLIPIVDELNEIKKFVDEAGQSYQSADLGVAALTVTANQFDEKSHRAKLLFKHYIETIKGLERKPEEPVPEELPSVVKFDTPKIEQAPFLPLEERPKGVRKVTITTVTYADNFNLTLDKLKLALPQSLIDKIVIKIIENGGQITGAVIEKTEALR